MYKHKKAEKGQASQRNFLQEGNLLTLNKNNVEVKNSLKIPTDPSFIFAVKSSLEWCLN